MNCRPPKPNHIGLIIPVTALVAPLLWTGCAKPGAHRTANRGPSGKQTQTSKMVQAREMGKDVAADRPHPGRPDQPQSGHRPSGPTAGNDAAYKERPGSADDALAVWSRAFKAVVRKLHPKMKQCFADWNGRALGRAARRAVGCGCRLLCNTRFPPPPGGGRIRVRYPQGYRLEIGPQGHPHKCSYRTERGPQTLSIELTCKHPQKARKAKKQPAPRP
jgi:hypothetical protein